MPGLPIDAPSRARILELSRGGSGVRAIARILTTEAAARPGSVQAVSVASVGRLIQEHRAEVNAGASPAKPSAPRRAPVAARPPSQPQGSAARPAPPVVASDAPPVEPAPTLPAVISPADLAAAELDLEADVSVIDEIHRRLRRLSRAQAKRVEQEYASASPDWALIQKLGALQKATNDEAIRTRPIVEHRPEADPCNLEMARSTTDTLLARIEAAENARPRATT